jgi:hypothetical protein
MSWYRTAARFEARNWSSLWRWARRRPRVPTGARGFSHDEPVRGLIVLFTLASAVEVVAVDLVLNHFLGHLPALRFGALVLGLWGVTAMLGYAAQLRTSPHLVAPDGLHVRHLRGTVRLPWDAVAAVEGRRRSFPESKSVQHKDSELHLPVQSTTNVVVRLRHPVVADLPGGPVTLDQLTFHADDPQTLVAAAGEHARSS